MSTELIIIIKGGILTREAFSRYSAPAPLIGYLYQCRYALLESIKKIHTEVEFTVSIETLDDVIFDPKAEPIESLQLKHNLVNRANLTNSSTEFWKTLRIWCEGISSGIIESDTVFFLVTTSIAPNNSAPSFLKCGGKRNVPKALKILNKVTKESENKDHKKYYNAFNSLSKMQKENLLNRIFVVDASPHIEDLNGLMKKELFFAAEKKHLNLFLEHLEGWWFRRIMNFITKSKKPILSQEIEDEIEKIREEFKKDNLPIDDEIVSATVTEEEYKNRTFVKQLEIIGMNKKSIYYAILNYFRAFEHRSKWVRNDLLLIGELDRYENQLFEQWDKHFARMKTKIGETATEKEKIMAANSFYEWIEDLSIPIRSSFNDYFLTNGSYQMLSEKKRVGWHPDFEKLITKLMGASE